MLEIMLIYFIPLSCHFSLQGKSQIVQEELGKIGEQMAKSSDGTKAIALGLCREFEDMFLQHIAGGEVSKSNAHPAGLYIVKS